MLNRKKCTLLSMQKNLRSKLLRGVESFLSHRSIERERPRGKVAKLETREETSDGKSVQDGQGENRVLLEMREGKKKEKKKRES